jgi:hypothetical protein
MNASVCAPGRGSTADCVKLPAAPKAKSGHKRRGNLLGGRHIHHGAMRTIDPSRPCCSFTQHRQTPYRTDMTIGHHAPTIKKNAGF